MARSALIGAMLAALCLHAAADPVDAGWLDDVPSTDSVIWEHNLDQGVRTLQRARDSGAFGDGDAVALARLLFAQAQLRGDAGLAGEALALVEPLDAAAALALRARVQLHLHRFDAAAASIGRLRASDGGAAAALSRQLRWSAGKAPSPVQDDAARHSIDYAGEAAWRVRQGDCGGAARMLDTAGAALADPDPMLISWLLLGRAGVAECLGAPQEARRLLLGAYRRLPRFTSVLEALARLARERDDSAEARRFLDEALAVSPAPQLRFELAQSQTGAARAASVRDAEQGYLRLARLFPEAYGAQAAAFYYADGRYGDAARMLAQAGEAAASFDARLLAAAIALAQQRRSDAVAALEAAQALGTDSLRQHCLLGELFMAAGRPDRAERTALDLQQRGKRACPPSAHRQGES